MGGNDISAVCGGKKTNLHAVCFQTSNFLFSLLTTRKSWDTGMIETNLKANYGGSVENWANALIDGIKVSAVNCTELKIVANDLISLEFTNLWLLGGFHVRASLRLFLVEAIYPRRSPVMIRSRMISRDLSLPVILMGL